MRQATLPGLLSLALLFPAVAWSAIPMELLHGLANAQGIPQVAGEMKATLVSAKVAGPSPLKWRVLEGEAGGSLVPLGYGQAEYRLPQVETPTRFHLQVTDADHPDATGTLEVEVLPPLLLQVGVPSLVQAGECELTATRGGLAERGRWGVQDPQGGRILHREGKVFYQAPPVVLPTTCRLGFMSFLTYEGEETSIQVLPAIRATASRDDRPCATLVAGNTYRLDAAFVTPSAEPLPSWVWTVAEGPGGEGLAQAGDGTTTFRAPATTQPTRVTLKVTDPSRPEHTALLSLDLLPQVPSLSGRTAKRLLPAAPGLDVPSLRAFGALPEGSRFYDRRVTALCSVGALGSAGPSWLVATDDGTLALLSSTGRRLKVGHIQGTVTALATEPRHPNWVVMATSEAGPEGPQARLWLLLLGSASRVDEPILLAGPGVDMTPPGPLGLIGGLAVRPDRTIVFLDGATQTIRQLAPGNVLTTLAGSPGPKEVVDGRGPEARFKFLRAIAADPGSEDLLVVDGPTLRRVRSDGTVTTLLGAVGVPDRSSSLASFEGQPVPEGLGLQMAASALQVHQGQILLAEPQEHVLRVFDPATRIIRTLAGDPAHNCFRPGPLRRFSPALPLLNCAALTEPTALAVSAKGRCLVGLAGRPGQALLGELDLGPPRAPQLKALAPATVSAP